MKLDFLKLIYTEQSLSALPVASHTCLIPSLTRWDIILTVKKKNSSRQVPTTYQTCPASDGAEMVLWSLLRTRFWDDFQTLQWVSLGKNPEEVLFKSKILISTL